MQLYGPYPPEKTRYNDAQLRAFNILVEASDTKIWLHVGLKLQGCLLQKARQICNGIVYTVRAFDESSLTVEDEQGSYTVPLAYERKIFSARSQTLDGTIAAHDMDSCHATEKHLLTAVSRGTSYDKIRVE